MKIVIEIDVPEAAANQLKVFLHLFKTGYKVLTLEERVKLRESCEAIDNVVLAEDGNVLTSMTCLARKLAAAAVPLLLVAKFVDTEAPGIERN